MRFDPIIFKEVLITIENDCPAGNMIRVEIPRVSNQEIYEYCMIAYEAGLIRNISEISSFDGDACFVSNLTLEGTKVLDKLRDEKIWKKVLKKIKETGPMTLSTLLNFISMIKS